MALFFFSRYHIATGKDMQDKVDFLLTGVRNDATTDYRGFLYKFFDSEVITWDGKEFITGHLVKYNPDDVEKVVNEETMKIIDEDVKNKVVGMARYIIDTSSSVIMYCEIPGVISKETFIKRFVELFETNHDNFFTEFSISPIKEQYSFIERIKMFKAVKKITITLFPSNPNYADRWRNIDERLRSNHITKYREVQENNKIGENIIIDEETESKFLMSEDGYGVSNAAGIDENGQENAISTEDTNKHVALPVNVDLNNVVDVLQTVADTLQDIVKRTQK